MTPQEIQHILRLLNAEDRDLTKKQQDKVRLAREQLEALLDELTAPGHVMADQRKLIEPLLAGQGLNLMHQRLQHQSNHPLRPWNNPYDFLPNDATDSGDDGSESKAIRARKKLTNIHEAAAHRRAMHESIKNAIAAIDTRFEGTLKEHRRNFADNYRRIHKARKVDGLVLVWNYRKRGKKPLITAEEHWYLKDRLEKKKTIGPHPEPSRDRRNSLDKALNDSTPAKRVIAELEALRKDLYVVRTSLQFYDLIKQADYANRYSKMKDELGKYYHNSLADPFLAGWAYTTPWTIADIERLMAETHDAVLHSAIETRGPLEGMIHYAPSGLKATADSLKQDDTEDDSGARERVFREMARFNAMMDYVPYEVPGTSLKEFHVVNRHGRLQRFGADDVKTVEDDPRFFKKGHLLDTSSKTHRTKSLASSREQLRRLIRNRGYEDNPDAARLQQKDLRNMIDEIDEVLTKARETIFDLQKTKFDKDNPNRYCHELKTMGKAADKVAAQIEVWESSVTLLVDKYNILLEIEDQNDLAGRTQLIDIVGVFLRSSLFASAEKRELFRALHTYLDLPYHAVPDRIEDYDEQDLNVNAYAADTPQSIIWPRWFSVEGHWIYWQDDPAPPDPKDAIQWSDTFEAYSTWRKEQLDAFTKHVEQATDDKKRRLLHELAFMMAMTEQIELAYLIEQARSDLETRKEVDWDEYAKSLERRMKRANGLILYVDSLEGAHGKIKRAVGWVLGRLHKSDYPHSGKVGISLSIALSAGKNFGDDSGPKVSLKASIVLKITGELTQEDDRRVRFKGMISLGLKAGAEGSAAIVHDFISTQAKVGVSKGLFAYQRSWVYADHDHLAASWAHKLALAYLLVNKPIRSLRHIGQAERAIDVVNVRSTDKEEERLLKLIAGDDYARMIELVRKPVLTSQFFWEGLGSLGDLQVTADASESFGPLKAGVHAETVVHLERKSTFWRDKYPDGERVVENWSPKGKAGGDVRTSKKGHVVVNTWAKSYPPMLSVDSFGTSFGDVIGFSGNPGVGLDVDIGFTHIDNHPNPDNNGMYLNIKVSRKSEGKVSLPYLSAATTPFMPLNRREVRLFAMRLHRLSDILTRRAARSLKVEDKEAADRLKEITLGIDRFRDKANPRKGAHGKLMRHAYSELQLLTAYGDFELNYVYTNRGETNGWALQYARVWRTISLSAKGEIETSVPGLTVDVAGSVEFARSPFETLGLDTVSYIQTVYDGLYNRENEMSRNAYWKAYRTAHESELLYLCGRIGRNASPPYAEVSSDEHADGAPEPKVNRDLMQAANVLLDACGRAGALSDPFAADGDAPKSGKPKLQKRSKQKNLKKLLVLRGDDTSKVQTTVRTDAPTSARAVKLVSTITGGRTKSWPASDGTLPTKEDRQVDQLFFYNPLEKHRIYYEVGNPHQIKGAMLELLDRSGTSQWKKSLDLKSAASGSDGASEEVAPPGPAAQLGNTLEDDEREDDRVLTRYVLGPEDGSSSRVWHDAIEADLPALSPDGAPYKLQLTVEPTDGEAERATVWTYFRTLDISIIEKLEAYMEAKRVHSIETQASRWAAVDGKDIPRVVMQGREGLLQPAPKDEDKSEESDDPTAEVSKNADYDSVPAWDEASDQPDAAIALAAAPPSDDAPRVYGGYGEYVVLNADLSPLSVGAFPDVCKIPLFETSPLYHLHHAGIANPVELSRLVRTRGQVLERRLQARNAAYNIAFIPRSLYELIIVNEVLRQELELPNVGAWRVKPLAMHSEAYLDPAINLERDNVDLSYALTEVVSEKLRKLLPSGARLPLTAAQTQQLLGQEINLFRDRVNAFAATRAQSTYVAQADGDEGAARPPSLGEGFHAKMGDGKLEAFINIIRRATDIEINADEAFLIYRGTTHAEDSLLGSNGFPISYNTGLFGGVFYDTSFVTFTPMFMLNEGARGYCLRLPYTDMTNINFPFHLPAGNALNQLSGKDQPYHAWTKATPSDALAYYRMDYRDADTIPPGQLLYRLRYRIDNRDRLEAEYQKYQQNAVPLHP